MCDKYITKIIPLLRLKVGWDIVARALEKLTVSLLLLDMLLLDEIHDSNRNKGT